MGEIKLALRQPYKGYVLGVTGQNRFWSWNASLEVAGTAEDIGKGIPAQDWLRLSGGAGSKGPPPKTTLIAKLAGAVVHSGDPASGDAVGTAAD